MRHRLPGLVTVVHHEPEVVPDPALPSNTPDRLQQLPTERLVVQLRQPGDVLSRHDQDVEGGLREDVIDGHDVIVLVDDGRRDLSRHDAAEQAIVHAAQRIPTWRQSLGS
jgi:hypothetical protein